MLGDSFTFGWGMEEEATYCSLLEKCLNASGGDGSFEVINAGVIGWGTRREVRYYPLEGRRFSPDVVVLNFFGYNDVDDVSRGFHAVSVRGGYLWDAPSEPTSGVSPIPLPLKGFLRQHSYLYLFVRDRYHLALQGVGLLPPYAESIRPSFQNRPRRSFSKP